MEVVSWFSAGASSAVATYYALKKYPYLKIIYIDIEDQHSDSIRFVKDCEKFYNKEIVILKSKYKSVDNVIRQFKYVNGPQGARCTMMLKKRVRQEWEMSNKPTHYVWGFDASPREKNRADRVRETMRKFEHIFPLIENKISKENVHGIVASWGIKRPVMYDLGYPNNNCVGCVKGGKGYWNKIRVDFPQVFKERAELERVVGASCIKGCYLDELEHNKGHKQKVVLPDCGHFCETVEDIDEYWKHL